MAASDSQPNRQVKGRSALRFYHEILGLDYLHYGLWAADDPLDRQGLETAQQRYADALLAFLPDSPRRVLDVGCGSGALCALMQSRGYEVEGLSPDAYQESIFQQRLDVPFHRDWFESFEPEHSFDCVVMSESAQYVDLDALFPAILRAAPTGDAVIADFFVTDTTRGEVSRRGHPLAGFKAAAEQHGFRLVQERDITQEAVPTLDLARHWVDQYVEPSAHLVNELYGDKHPILLRFARWVLRRRVDEYRKMLAQIDRDEFLAAKRYLILQLRRDANV